MYEMFGVYYTACHVVLPSMKFRKSSLFKILLLPTEETFTAQQQTQYPHWVSFPGDI
jgi:hypothetical protein